MNESENSSPLTGSDELPHASTTSLGEQSDFPDLKIYGYQILEKLSEREDGKRITYLAKEVKSDRAVVIKQWRLPDSQSLSLNYASYLPEIGRLQQLEYPNIPPYLNSFPTATGFCIVRAYQSGVSLAELKTLPPGDIDCVADAVLKILVYLQQLEPIVIHQNIKPENIIVNTEQELMVYLVDFGLCSLRSISQPIAGMPGFIPPEQLSEGALTPSTDIYSLGVSLICLLTGTPTAKAHSLLTDRFQLQFQHLVPQNTPTRLLDTLAKMVAPEERQRYPDAASASNPTIELSPRHPQPADSSPQSNNITSFKKPRRRIKLKWWYWAIGASVIILGINLILRQFVFTEPEELSPAQIAKNQKIVKEAAFVASDRGKIITEKRCIGCDLRGQDFAKADLTGVVLTQSKLNGANFTNANLKLAILRDVDLSDANLTQADLQQAAFYGAKLIGTRLVSANLTNSKLIYANLKGASMQKANLTNANLQAAELPQVDLTNANLTGADLSDADLTGANLRRATLTGAKLTGTKLTGATMPDGSIHP